MAWFRNCPWPMRPMLPARRRRAAEPGFRVWLPRVECFRAALASVPAILARVVICPAVILRLEAIRQLEVIQMLPPCPVLVAQFPEAFTIRRHKKTFHLKRMLCWLRKIISMRKLEMIRAPFCCHRHRSGSKLTPKLAGLWFLAGDGQSICGRWLHFFLDISGEMAIDGSITTKDELQKIFQIGRAHV